MSRQEICQNGFVQTLRDSKLDAPLSTRTRSGFQHGSYASDCYALVVSRVCDEDERVTFDEAQHSKNWWATMQSKFDAIMKNVIRLYKR